MLYQWLVVSLLLFNVVSLVVYISCLLLCFYLYVVTVEFYPFLTCIFAMVVIAGTHGRSVFALNGQPRLNKITINK